MSNNYEMNKTVLSTNDNHGCTSVENVSSFSFYKFYLSGFQGVIPTLMNLIYLPLSLFSYFCLLPDEVECGKIIFTLFFYSGIATILQASIGIRYAIMLSPSLELIYGTILFLKSPYFEAYSPGDLYAIGHFLRSEECNSRTGELRGVFILSGFICTVLCGFLWYLPEKLPASTVIATLLSFFLSRICNIVHEITNNVEENSTWTVYAFIIPLFFYIIGKLKIPNCVTMNYKGIVSKDLKQFMVLLTFVALVLLNFKLENGSNNMLQRALGTINWFSFNFPLRVSELTLPKFTGRSLAMLPVLFSQFIISYCCYCALNTEKKIHLKALFLETMLLIIFSGLGVPVPLTVDPASIGLMHLTRVKDLETSVISGGLLILLSMLVKIVALLSFVTYPIMLGLNMFLYGQLFTKVLSEMPEVTESSGVVAMSVLTGMICCSIPVELGDNILYNCFSFLFTCPTVITFFVSLVLTVANRSSWTLKN